jgi:hypothetical protein
VRAAPRRRRPAGGWARARLRAQAAAFQRKVQPLAAIVPTVPRALPPGACGLQRPELRHEHRVPHNQARLAAMVTVARAAITTLVSPIDDCLPSCQQIQPCAIIATVGRSAAIIRAPISDSASRAAGNRALYTMDYHPPPKKASCWTVEGYR